MFEPRKTCSTIVYEHLGVRLLCSIQTIVVCSPCLLQDFCNLWDAVCIKTNNSVNVHFTSRCAVSLATIPSSNVSFEATNCSSDESQLRRRMLAATNFQLRRRISAATNFNWGDELQPKRRISTETNFSCDESLNFQLRRQNSAATNFNWQPRSHAVECSY